MRSKRNVNVCRMPDCKHRHCGKILANASAIEVRLQCIHLRKYGRYRNGSNGFTQRYRCAVTGETFNENTFDERKRNLHKHNIPIMEIFNEYYDYGFKITEIARRYKVTPSTIRNRIERAKRILAQENKKKVFKK